MVFAFCTPILDLPVLVELVEQGGLGCEELLREGSSVLHVAEHRCEGLPGHFRVSHHLISCSVIGHTTTIRPDLLLEVHEWHTTAIHTTTRLLDPAVQPAQDVLVNGVHPDLDGHLLVGHRDRSLRSQLRVDVAHLLQDGVLASGHEVVDHILRDVGLQGRQLLLNDVLELPCPDERCSEAEHLLTQPA